MSRVRLQRMFLKDLKDKKMINKNTFRDLYKKSKGGFFRSKRHIKIYLDEHDLIKKKGTKKVKEPKKEEKKVEEKKETKQEPKEEEKDVKKTEKKADKKKPVKEKKETKKEDKKIKVKSKKLLTGKKNVKKK